MLITNFMYCENVREESGKPVIINPLLMLVPYSVPSNYSFFVTVGIHDLPKKGVDIEFTFKDLNDMKLMESSFNIPPVKDMPEKEKAAVQINVGFQNLLLKEVGIYKTVINVPGVLNQEFPIEVIPNVK